MNKIPLQPIRTMHNNERKYSAGVYAGRYIGLTADGQATVDGYSN